jgi:hypothetical protein
LPEPIDGVFPIATNFVKSADPASGVPGKPQRWDTVADLYNKIRTTQPAYDVAGLSTNEYVDIVAYLLKQNEFPAGNEELKDDVPQMRNMTLDKGFERLFNGKDLTGWGFLIGTNCTPAPEGCGQTTPGATYRAEKETLFDSGTPHGMAYPKKKFWNLFSMILCWPMNHLNLTWKKYFQTVATMQK